MAVQGFGDAPLPGYQCAMMALWVPLSALTNGMQGLGANGSGTTALMLSVLPAGLANVGFAAAAFLRQAGHVHSAAFQRLRVYVVLMAASSWVAFVFLALIPREGNLLWIAGIALTLFPEEIAARIARRKRAGAPGI